QPSAQPLERIPHLLLTSNRSALSHNWIDNDRMPSIKTDSPLLPTRDDVTPSDKRFHLRCHPINHHAPNHTAKESTVASHNESLKTLTTISPKTANELMIKHFEHFGQ
ncbi:hypothetical protein TNCV_4376011, partial [Trichonephila clavipes]